MLVLCAMPAALSAPTVVAPGTPWERTLEKLPAQAIPPVLLGAVALIVAQKVVQAVVAATVGPEPKAKTK